MTTDTAPDLSEVVEAARQAADAFVTDYGRGYMLDTLLLREWFEVDAANGGWSDATWLVYERAARERWDERQSDDDAPSVVSRQRCATIPIPRLDDSTVEIRLRSGRHRDSDPPPFTR